MICKHMTDKHNIYTEIPHDLFEQVMIKPI